MNMGSSSGSDDLLSLNLGFPCQTKLRKSTAVEELEPSTPSLSLSLFGGEHRTTTTNNNKAIISCCETETETEAENSSSPEINYYYYYYYSDHNNNTSDNNKSRTSNHHHQYSSPPSSMLTSLSAVAVNVKRERDAPADFDFDFDFELDVRSVSASKALTVGNDDDEQQQQEDNMTSSNHIINNGQVTADRVRKKLRLSKDQSALLEESFKHHTTLNPKQKLALANQLALRPRQVEVWFQNRRARTKLKQTEVDCEFLRKCCETLTEENRRLEKELQELRSIKQNQVQRRQQSQANSLYMTMMHFPDPTTTTTTTTSKEIKRS